MINWKFPSNDNGELIGLNNAGIETFLGEPISSLAREINQNSLDASDVQSRRPVEVHFTVEQVDSKLFPGRDEFLGILDSCLNYWTENKKAKAFFEKAKGTLSAETITVLKISDFFTTGLTGSEETKGGNWINLTKGSGVSDKPGDAGGAFGIGKNASYASSSLRTVFYNTKDIDGKTAFQGVAKLVTHLDKDGQGTQGTGYFGFSPTKSPVKNLEQIPEFFRRSTVGTDVFVFGFDGGQDWEAKIIRSVLENFFVAIHQRKLIVAVGKTRLDDTTLPEMIEKHFGSDSESECAKYFQAFTSDDAKFFSLDDFEGLGRIELHVLRGQHFPKRVAMVRQTGMLVFYKGHFQTPMKFAGVMRATGDGINSLLRSLEPPSHTKWETQRHEDPAYARRIVKCLYDWVRDCVKQTSQEGVEEEYDFEGMQQYLPDDLEDEPDKSSKADGEKSIPKEVELVIRDSKKASQPGEHQPSKSSDGEDDDATNTNDHDDSNSQNSTSSAQPGNSGDGGTEEGEGSKNQDSDGQGAPTRTPVTFRKLRAFCSDPTAGEYRVIFQPTKQIEGFLQLRVVGEVEESIAPAISATYAGNPISIRSDGLIGPIMFIDNSTQEISVVLANRLHCALEVAGYENQ